MWTAVSREAAIAEVCACRKRGEGLTGRMGNCPTARQGGGDGALPLRGPSHSRWIERQGQLTALGSDGSSAFPLARSFQAALSPSARRPARL
jgi:hypothetical protein